MGLALYYGQFPDNRISLENFDKLNSLRTGHIRLLILID